MMRKSKSQLFLRHFIISAIVVILFLSDDILCQKRNSRRRPVTSKTLDYLNLIQSAPYNNNNRNTETKNSSPVNLMKNTKGRKWKKPSLSSSVYSLSKRKGLTKPKLLSKFLPKNTGNPHLKNTRQRPSRGFKLFGGNREKSSQHLIKKLGPLSLTFGRSKKHRPVNRGIGLSRSGSLRSQSYSSLPTNSGNDNGIRRQLSTSDNRVKRKVSMKPK